MSSLTPHETTEGRVPARSSIAVISLMALFIVAIAGLAEWLLDVPTTTLGADVPPLEPPTTIVLLTASATLLLVTVAQRWVVLVAAALTTVTSAAALITVIVESGRGWWGEPSTPVLIAIPLLCLAAIFTTIGNDRIANPLAATLLAFAYFSIIAILLDVSEDSGLIVAPAPAPAAALALLAGSKFVFAANGGAVIARRRRRIPVAAKVLGWVTVGVQLALPATAVLVHLGSQNGWWSTGSALNLLGFASACFLVGLGIRAGALIEQFAEERDTALEQLQRTNDQLQSRVTARTAEADDLKASVRAYDDELRASDERFRLLAESAPVGIYRLDADYRCIYANPKMREIFGRPFDELDGPGLLATIEPDDMRRIEAGRSDEGPILEQEVTIVRPNGERRRVRSVASQVYVDGTFAGQVGTADDVTERVAKTARLDAERRTNALLIDESPTPIFVADAAGRLVRINAAAEALLRTDERSILGSRLDDWIDADTSSPAEIAQHDLDGTPAEMTLVRADGTSVWVQIRAAAIDSDDETRTYAQVIDIDERHRHEQHLEQLVETDQLTGMASRYRFEQELESWVERGAVGAVMVADLDHFKRINDTLGHRAGDELLRTVGEILREEIRSEDLAARLGGDEFGVLLTGADAEIAERVAGRLVDTIRTRTAELFGQRLGVSASIGVILCDGTHESTSALLMDVDAAMYDAKDAGRNAWRLSSSTATPSGTRSRLADVDRIERALADDQLRLFAQPITRLDGSPELHELLLRVRDDDGMNRTPGPFLESAERFGIIGEIDRWVIARACGLSERTSTVDGSNAMLACNVSGSSIASGWIVEYVERHLRTHSVPPGRLVLELTETHAIPDRAAARANAADLARLGVGIALDDFGAGHMSFANLRDFPVDIVKIDGSFVIRASHLDVDRFIVSSVVELGHLLGARVVAEHVEHERDIALLADLGVDLLQGFAVGPPVPVEEALQLAPSGRRATRGAHLVTTKPD